MAHRKYMKIIYSNSCIPSRNLALEEYLFSKSTDDFLLFYVNESCVVLGSNQVAVNEVNMEFCQLNNIGVYRRMSGGGAVYHDEGNLNYCFISNKQEDISALNGDFLLPVIDVLNSMGIPVHAGVRKDLWLPGEYKISGTASHISKNRRLHHGTLLYKSNIDVLQTALTVTEKNENLKGTQSVPGNVKNISAYIEEQGGEAMPASGFFEALITRFSNYYHTEITETEANDAEIAEIEMKYLDPEWIYKK